jgi:hypothetical protein
MTWGPFREAFREGLYGKPAAHAPDPSSANAFKSAGDAARELAKCRALLKEHEAKIADLERHSGELEVSKAEVERKLSDAEAEIVRLSATSPPSKPAMSAHQRDMQDVLAFKGVRAAVFLALHKAELARAEQGVLDGIETSAEFSDLRGIFSTDGVKAAILHELHPDHHPGITEVERRQRSDAIVKFRSIYARLKGARQG